MSGLRRFDDVGECVEAALARLGGRIVLAAPLAIGKPNPLLNEFYRRAARDPAIRLTILTALSLNRPAGRSDLERRFLAPFTARLFGDYPDLEYLKAARAGRLPPNIEVREFYLQAGAWLGVESVQRDYVSVNYTHV
ncbi:MAG: acetyl-CoA hydrolase, partial [Proteobacteria bacterium]|nr:acetyl-CoA hydrolase [Pseudomonadota bacterium]